MEKIFEEKCMEVQIRIVSTCMEGLEETQKKPQMMYIYSFDSEYQSFFNVFFEYNGKILSYEEIGVSEDTIDQIFDFGMEDTEELCNLFKQYNNNSPNQYRIIYNIEEDKLDIEYNYDDLQKGKLSPFDVFKMWKETVKVK